ncbi:bucentaur or craniofacial development-domain-containing protein [Pilaira anomala]|nr:bucentaur or craniofacial development-domain-containing protein [Pilaira anomala]
MSKQVSLKDFYNNTNNEEEDEESEQDSDFVPEEEESEGEVNTDAEEDEEEEEEEEEKTVDKGKKRSLSAPPIEEEDASVKKTRIDAIWADMNEPKNEATTKATTTTNTTTTNTSTTTTETKQAETVTIKKKTTIKRPKSSLSSLVSQYNIKEPKMNTLDKSKLDWQGYVDREGIRDDLKYKNKDGYMEKVAFLQRVDDRRLNQLKTGQKNEKK